MVLIWTAECSDVLYPSLFLIVRRDIFHTQEDVLRGIFYFLCNAGIT